MAKTPSESTLIDYNLYCEFNPGTSVRVRQTRQAARLATLTKFGSEQEVTEGIAYNEAHGEHDEINSRDQDFEVMNYDDRGGQSTLFSTLASKILRLFLESQEAQGVETLTHIRNTEEDNVRGST